jgi:hypothetical protein
MIHMPARWLLPEAVLALALVLGRSVEEAREGALQAT